MPDISYLFAMLGSQKINGDDYFFMQEYDRRAAEEIRTLFDNLEMILFENQMRGSSQLLEECRDWVSRFPHLR